MISVIVVTYLEENKPYLDLCLKSIDALDYYKNELEVIVINSNPKWKLDGAHNTQKRMHYPEAVNLGVSLANKNSTHYLLLNDDTCLTKQSLKALMEASRAIPRAIFNPLSNCDNNTFYGVYLMAGPHQGPNIPMGKRFYRLPDAPDAETLINSRSIYPPAYFPLRFCPLYATLIPKEIWEEVGSLDPNYKTGQDDIDYANRCHQKGIQTMVAINSVIWHFGGTTADIALDDKTRRDNIEYYKKKWNEAPL